MVRVEDLSLLICLLYFKKIKGLSHSIHLGGKKRKIKKRKKIITNGVIKKIVKCDKKLNVYL